MNNAYETYLRLWWQIDELWKTGKGESFEADQIRDKMDDPWFAMTGAERQKFMAAVGGGRSNE